MLRRQHGHVPEREIHDFIGYLDGRLANGTAAA